MEDLAKYFIKTKKHKHYKSNYIKTPQNCSTNNTPCKI